MSSTKPRGLRSLARGLAAAALALLSPTQPSALAKSPAAPSSRAESVPRPHQVQSRSAPLKQSKTALVEFETAPFPYEGWDPTANKTFLDVEEAGRRGHTTPFGRVYWQDETYSSRQVLLHIPKGFDVRRPCLMIVYFHGHGATLERDVRERQQLPTQITDSGMNAVLVAPQLAVDAADSSAGRFWEPGAFGRFVGEAAEKLARLHGDRRSVRTFASMPVVIVAYSGGYLPAAWAMERGGLKKRLRGIVLLDALYGALDKFAAWIESNRSAFFVSAYLDTTREKNAELERILTERTVSFNTELDQPLRQGSVTILPGGTDATHRDLLTHGWVANPVEDLLKRLAGYRR